MTIWFDDALPAGATPVSDSDGWNWVGSSPSPYSGTQAHQSAIASGAHQHYFTGASTPLSIAAGDRLYTYIYLDPANPPTEAMLQWNDGSGWEHRAYWGANSIPYGIDGTDSRRYVGPLPATGQWALLAVHASRVGLGAGSSVNGMAFTLYDGRATWDAAGISADEVAYARPTSDIASNGWLASGGGPLYAAIDETSLSASDYIYSPDDPVDQQFEVRLGTLSDPGVNTGHVVRIGLQAVGADTTFDFYLVENTTVRDSWTENVTVAAGVVTRTRTLSGTVADSISDYTNLRIRGVARA